MTMQLVADPGPAWLVQAAEEHFKLTRPQDVGWRRLTDIGDFAHISVAMMVKCGHGHEQKPAEFMAPRNLVAERGRQRPVFIGQCPTCKTIYWAMGEWER